MFFSKNGRKKSSKSFSDLLLICAAMIGGGYSVFQEIRLTVKVELEQAFFLQFDFCIKGLLFPF